MKTIPNLTRSLASLLALCTGLAQADPTPTVRLQHHATPSSLTRSIWTSHSGTIDESTYDYRVFNDIRFDRGEKITEFRWEGIYANITSEEAGRTPLTSSNTREWELTIWSDQGGEPFKKLYSEMKPAAEVPYSNSDTVEIPTWGITIPRYKFSFSLATPFETEPGKTYWISARSLTEEFWPFFVMLPGRSLNQLPAPTTDGQISSMISSEKCLQLDQSDGGSGAYSQKGEKRAISVVTLPINDSDNDGMDDLFEQDNGLNVGEDDSAEDPDEDGLTNLQEFERNTDPKVADMDGDGLLDSVETNTGVYRNENDRGSSPYYPDSDKDGLTDDLENPAQGYIPNESAGSDPNWPDTDEDGMTDLREFQIEGTNPSRKDTDGDGILDPWEIDNGSNPSNANSPFQISMTPLGTPTQTWTETGELPSFNGFNGSQDTADVTFRLLIDFDEKPVAPSSYREVIFETGGGTVGFSLTREPGNTLALRASGGGGYSLATLEYTLSEAQISGGPVEIVWAFDVLNELGNQTIGLWIDGLMAGEVKKYLGQDWSGGDVANFGEATDAMAGSGRNSGIWGTNFVTGNIDLEQGLQIYTSTYPVNELQLRPPFLQITSFKHLPATNELELRWKSEEGFTYNLLSANDPASDSPEDWPVFGGLQNIAPTPPQNSLTIPVPNEPRRIFILRETPIEP